MLRVRLQLNEHAKKNDGLEKLQPAACILADAIRAPIQ